MDNKIGSGIYFLTNSNATNPVGFRLFSSIGMFFSIRPANGNGWGATPTNITGGLLDFYFGYVPANSEKIAANYIYYSTGTTTPPVTSDFQILGTEINSVANQFRNFIFKFTVTVTSGQQFSIRLVNNLTTSADPGFGSEINGFISFVNT